MAKTPAPKKPKKLALKKTTIKDLGASKSKGADVKGGAGGAYTFTCAQTKCYC